MKIIAFEGIDASGKETQVSLLKEYLENLGKKVVTISFPRYYTEIGQIIRDSLHNKTLSDRATHILFEIDRILFMSKFEEQADKYDYLVLDRYTLSNLAFMKARNLIISEVTDMQDLLAVPDITFFIDVNPHTCLARKQELNTELDTNEKDLALQEKAYLAYRELIDKKIEINGLDELIYRVDGEYTANEVHESIIELLTLSKVV